MSIKVILEKKEQLNEILGTVVMWSVISILVGKLLTYKFGGESSDKISNWGRGLGNAFKFSKTKLAGANLSDPDKQKVSGILSKAESRIQDLVKKQAMQIKTNPETRISIDRDIEEISDLTVSEISDVVRDRRVASEFVEPIRSIFGNLKSDLLDVRKGSALQTLSTNSRLRDSLSSIKDPEKLNSVIDIIATRVSKNVI